MKILTKNEEETKKVATQFANFLNKNSINNVIILLNGELGSGKTKFVEGFTKFYNLDSEISSPTFNIVNTYSTTDIKINHFDVYRVESYDELLAIGFDEYLSSDINLIEWGSIIEDDLSPSYCFISINIFKDKDNFDFRNIEFSSNCKDLSNIILDFKV